MTTSTTEAELLAISHVASLLLWWKRFFNALTLDLDEDYTINCDNLQTVRLLVTKAPKLVTKLRHVDVHQHWLRQEVEARSINIQWISTTDMPADGMTKALPKQKHKTFLQQLNLVDISPILEDR